MVLEKESGSMRLEDDGQHGAFKQGHVLRKALPVEGNLPDRFQGAAG